LAEFRAKKPIGGYPKAIAELGSLSIKRTVRLAALVNRYAWTALNFISAATSAGRSSVGIADFNSEWVR
jgi:hypothetical protein